LAARIYSLAKELKIDSKELVDICTKAGITGKGSALASLADDEVARLKEFLGAGRSRPAERSSAASGGGSAVAVAAPPEKKTLTREQYMPPAGVSGRPPVLEVPKSDKPPEVRKKPLEPRPITRGSPAVRLAQLPPSSAKAPAAPPKPATSCVPARRVRSLSRNI
jgi:translation initiation factor IF-2